MASSTSPRRVDWVVATLAVAPGDEILEIGTGAGTAMDRVCRLLTTGHITGIDRSAAAVRRATTRNAPHIADGRATLHCVDLADLHLPGKQFTKIFAVNVSLFWVRDCPTEMTVVRRLLVARSALYLFHHGPGPDRVRRVAQATAAMLQRHSLCSRAVYSDSGTLSCVVARPR